jgi:hypothetical protein
VPSIANFRHLSTRISFDDDPDEPVSGQTVWVAHVDGNEAGMAWDWVQIARGVVAMADPMSIVTNLQLVGTTGEVLTPLQAARYLNELLRGLPWQEEVQRALRAQTN